MPRVFAFSRIYSNKESKLETSVIMSLYYFGDPLLLLLTRSSVSLIDKLNYSCSWLDSLSGLLICFPKAEMLAYISSPFTLRTCSIVRASHRRSEGCGFDSRLGLRNIFLSLR